MSKTVGHTENGQVTAYGDGFVYCKVVSWASSLSGGQTPTLNARRL